MHGAQSDFAGHGFEKAHAAREKRSLERKVLETRGRKMKTERSEAGPFATQRIAEEGEFFAGKRKVVGEGGEMGQACFGPGRVVEMKTAGGGVEFVTESGLHFGEKA